VGGRAGGRAGGRGPTWCLSGRVISSSTCLSDSSAALVLRRAASAVLHTSRAASALRRSELESSGPAGRKGGSGRHSAPGWAWAWGCGAHPASCTSWRLRARQAAAARLWRVGGALAAPGGSGSWAPSRAERGALGGTLHYLCTALLRQADGLPLSCQCSAQALRQGRGGGGHPRRAPATSAAAPASTAALCTRLKRCSSSSASSAASATLRGASSKSLPAPCPGAASPPPSSPAQAPGQHPLHGSGPAPFGELWLPLPAGAGPEQQGRRRTSRGLHRRGAGAAADPLLLRPVAPAAASPDPRPPPRPPLRREQRVLGRLPGELPAAGGPA
jgi:hypothetical protein